MNTTKMYNAPGTTTTAVSVDGRSIPRGADGSFDVPDDQVGTLRSHGLTTVKPTSLGDVAKEKASDEGAKA